MFGRGVRFNIRDVRLDKAGDADFGIDAHFAGCDFAVVAPLSCEVAALRDAEVARTRPRRVVAEHIQRPLAGVQPVAAALDLAVRGKFFAYGILHPAALHIFVHALVGNDFVFHLVLLSVTDT